MESEPGSSTEPLEDVDSPLKKRQKRTSFTANEKQMILNVHNYVKQTWPNDEYPYRTSITDKTSSILGIGVASVYRVIKEHTSTGNAQSSSTTKKRLKISEKVDEFDKKAIATMNNGHTIQSQLPSSVKIEKNDTEDELDSKSHKDDYSKSISPEPSGIDQSIVKDELSVEYTSPESEMCVLKTFVDRCMKVECDEVVILKPSSKTHDLQKNESTKSLTTEVQTVTTRKRKKTNAQRCREYRQRKKLQNRMVQNITADRSDECSGTDQLPAKKPKTDAERRKKYYEAQKLKKQKIKKIPKTDKQRSKEYYYRKKKSQALNTLNHHSDAASTQRGLQYEDQKQKIGTGNKNIQGHIYLINL